MSFFSDPTSRVFRGVAAYATLVLVIVVGAADAVVYDLYRFRDARAGQLLPGTTIAGVDVGGMTRGDAADAIKDSLAPQLDRTVTIAGDGKQWTTTPRELGVSADVDEALDAALARAEKADLSTFARMRWTGAEVPFEADVVLGGPASAAVDQLVATVADELAVAPKDAELVWNDQGPWVEPAETGQRVDVDKLRADLLAALDGGPSRVEVAVEEVTPEHGADHYDQVLFLRQREHRLDVYLDGRLARTYQVAVGTGGYPTPTGQFYVSKKRPRPVWVNPAPNGWGAGMPRRIGPGPNNPLGLRALNWSGGQGIRFHGTSNVASIGTDASHGCVRLTNDDIVELFDLVDVGAHIVSVR